MAASGSGEAHLLLHCLGGSFDGQCSLPGEGIDMRVSVWGNFPVDLLQNIVTRLPPTSLARFRAVAKGWRDFLSSPEAKKLVMMALPVCALEYRPASPRASAGTLPSSPAASSGKDTAVIRLALCYLPPAYHGCGKQDFFAVDGLVCFRAYVDGFWRFCVVNPMTRKYQELPQRLVGRTESKKKQMLVRLCNMAVETSPLELSFRVLVASRPWDANAAAVFSSETGRWKRLSQWRQERQYVCQLDDKHNYHVSSKRVVAVHGATDVCFFYEEGVDKAKQTDPSHLNYRSYIDSAVETVQVQVQNELFCVEQPEMSQCESELTWGGLQCEEELRIKIHRLDDKDNLWSEECSMPLTIGGRSLQGLDPEEQNYGYVVGQVAVVKNAICLAIGVKIPGEWARLFQEPGTYPQHFEYSNVVLYHPKSRSWELVALDVPPSSFSLNHQLFEPTF